MAAPFMLMGTFSIAARDEVTGMLGVAVASKVLAVGATCPFVRAGIGAIASQAYLNPKLGVDGLIYLAEGLSAEQTLHRILARDEGRDWRQVNIIDNRGYAANNRGIYESTDGGQRWAVLDLPWSHQYEEEGVVALVIS